jgi:plasmid stabilization system protein ParE
VQTKLGRFCTAEEAARAHDDAARKAGRRAVNFPRPGTGEVQAVKGEEEKVTLLRHAGKLLPPRSGPLPPAPKYKGVFLNAAARTAAVFAAAFTVGGVRTLLGTFCTAQEAARAYDDAMRNDGRRVVNFPRPGTDEVQAVKGEEEKHTLARHTSAQQAAGGASAAGAITPSVIASPPPKRRAAAPPPSEPPRKRTVVPIAKSEAPAAAASVVPAAPPPPRYTRHPPHRIERESSLPPGFVAPLTGIKTETPAAVKPEAPVAPLPARYTRRPPHCIDTATTPPPEPVAPAASIIKTETPAAAVKPETPAAPAMPAAAVPGWAPPSASAATAPPVKMEHDCPASGAAFRKRGAQ